MATTEILEKQATATMDDFVREFSKVKSIVADAVDEGVRSALRAARRGRNIAEDAYDDAVECSKKAIRRNPLQALGIACAAVAVTGGLVAWLAVRRR